MGARLIANDLLAVGIDVDCLPIADVPTPDADPVIGDRAYGGSAEKVAAIAGAIADGLMEGGVLPVLKHLPGHGRATADSHHRLPTVTADRASLEAVDFAAFRPLAGLDLGMTAHVVFSAYDPVAPATTSVTMVQDVIRDSIGFEGLLMSDDISMGALSGTLAERSAAALTAGCDVILHCNGNIEEMRAVAGAVPALTGDAGRPGLHLPADYLGMGAGLVSLKSLLWLPDGPGPEGQTAEDMANALALRLKRLEAIRDVAERLFGRPLLDRDIFSRGQPEPIAHIKRPEWTATLYDLLSAYAARRQKHALARLHFAKRAVWSLAEAREVLERLIARSSDWPRPAEYLIAYVVDPALAST